MPADVAAFSCRTPLVEKLLNYWNGLRAGRPMPSRADIDPVAIKPLLSHIMLVDLSYNPVRARYRLVGTEIVRSAHFDFTGLYADEIQFESNDGTDWNGCYRRVAEGRVPGFGISHWMIAGETQRWIEFLICPLSSDGVTIDKCISIEDHEPLNPVELDTLPTAKPR
ncbi:MAG: PAS domain-containing protein [Dongiaceae bacterium]